MMPYLFLCSEIIFNKTFGSFLKAYYVELAHKIIYCFLEKEWGILVYLLYFPVIFLLLLGAEEFPLLIFKCIGKSDTQSINL